MAMNILLQQTATQPRVSDAELLLRQQKLTIINNCADAETLTLIANLIQKPNACNKFKSALNNPMVKMLF